MTMRNEETEMYDVSLVPRTTHILSRRSGYPAMFWLMTTRRKLIVYVALAAMACVFLVLGLKSDIYFSPTWREPPGEIEFPFPTQIA